MTAEAVVGGVIGPLDAPEVLILGRVDGGGRLRVAGRTRRLPIRLRAEIGAVLEPPKDQPHVGIGTGGSGHSRSTLPAPPKTRGVLADYGDRCQHPGLIISAAGAGEQQVDCEASVLLVRTHGMPLRHGS